MQEITAHETSHHPGKQSRVIVSSKDEDDDYEEDEPVATTLASVIKRPTTERYSCTVCMCVYFCTDQQGW